MVVVMGLWLLFRDTETNAPVAKKSESKPVVTAANTGGKTDAEPKPSQSAQRPAKEINRIQLRREEVSH